MEVAMNAICRFVANAFSRARHRSLLIALIIPFLAALQPSPAKAITQDEAIDFAVEAAARGGQLLGLSVPEDAKELLKELVKCGANGTPITDCAKQSMINVLLRNVPDEAKKMVGCLLGGGDALACAKQAGLDNLPPEVKPVVECMLSGKTVAECAGNAVLDQASKELLEKLKGLKADAEQALNEQEGTVKSIIEIAKGIQTGDWAKVIYFGGKEFAKVVLTVLVEILCPPCALIAGPVVAALVDLYGGLAEDVFKIVTTGDFGKLPEVLFEFYFRELIARPCALLPDGGFKDAICGNLAKVIAAAAGVFGDAVDFILGVAEDLLKATGIWQVGEAIVGFIGGVIDDLFGDGLEDPKVCGRADAFFAKNYLPCLGAAAGASAGASPMSALRDACMANFKRCYGDKAGQICDGLDKALNDQAQQVNAALEEGARNYTPAVGAFIYGRRAEFCVAGKDKSIENFRSQMSAFAEECTKALGKNVPLQVAACTFKPASITRPPGPSLACSKAVANSGWERIVEETCAKWCRESRNNCPPDPPPCWKWGNVRVEQYGFVYEFSGLERNMCVMKYPGVWDKIWSRINPPNVIYDNRYTDVINVLQNPTVRNPVWSSSKVDAVANAVAPSLSLGSCRSARTMLTANVQWVKTPQRTRLTQLLQAPMSDATRAAISSMFAIRPTPAMTETLQLSLTPVALVPSFDSCPATASLASRGSSGSDGSFTPRSSTTTTTVKRTPERGGATAARPQGSSGSDMSRSSSPAIERLTGDGSMGGAPTTPLYRLPDTSRGPMPGRAAGTRGSSGASSVQGSQSSSGSDRVQPGGTPGTRSGGSSGASSVQSTGTSVPRPGSDGVLRTNRPSNIEIFRRQQEEKPYYPPLR
jgi:hypothetical protein